MLPAGSFSVVFVLLVKLPLSGLYLPSLLLFMTWKSGSQPWIFHLSHGGASYLHCPETKEMSGRANCDHMFSLPITLVIGVGVASGCQMFISRFSFLDLVCRLA